MTIERRVCPVDRWTYQPICSPIKRAATCFAVSIKRAKEKDRSALLRAIQLPSPNSLNGRRARAFARVFRSGGLQNASNGKCFRLVIRYSHRSTGCRIVSKCWCLQNSILRILSSGYYPLHGIHFALGWLFLAHDVRSVFLIILNCNYLEL